MNLLDLLKGKTDEGQKVIKGLRQKENKQFYWHPGSYNDMRGIEWYMEKEINSEPQFDDPIPFFVCNNPEFVRSTENIRRQLSQYSRWKKPLYDENIKIYPVEFDPVLAFRLMRSDFTEDVLSGAGIRAEEIIVDAKAYLVEFHFNEEFKYDHFTGTDNKLYKVARSFKDQIFYDVETEVLKLDIKEVKKYYRLCLGCGNYSFIKYCLENQLKFEQIYPLDSTYDPSFLGYKSVMKHFFPFLSDYLVVDEDLHSENGNLFGNNLHYSQIKFLEIMSENHDACMQYSLTKIDECDVIKDYGSTEQKKMFKYRIVC